MEEVQEEPIFEEMHDTNIPFESEQREDYFPSFELLHNFQPSKTLTKMHNFWVE
jgi:hypothetical protein